MPDIKSLRAATDVVAVAPQGKDPSKMTVDELFATDQSTWEWVEVPETDMFDYRMDPVQINRRDFGPGRHLVPPIIASQIRERLKAKELEDIRVLSPRKQLKALIELAKARGGAYSNPENFKEPKDI